MNDYWNDPPDEPDAVRCPCCDVPMDVATGIGTCPKCGATLELPDDDTACLFEAEAEAVGADGAAPSMRECPHGVIGPCDACDAASDHAYECARERRHFGR